MSMWRPTLRLRTTTDGHRFTPHRTKAISMWSSCFLRRGPTSRLQTTTDGHHSTRHRRRAMSM
ncbi:hypothetical protein BDP55DRAFT_656736 [Colletotrichum godetiae]|uniref:Uncharacterized protein n=1 Tax=Colletotrichum godetiae TaxID=1209918 RepID=A0AAJ0AQU0_9PEZI|nr:uncharacterized protein BDP55DRAFT_656736 [Colletotrichum godetiae]KAK1688671.1 hypothetical protein BDP55DRAFT_656736 [Colletotrichum godetiae]